MSLKRTILTLLVLGWCWRSQPLPAAPAAQSAAGATFSKEILPVLSEYCYGCHGEKKQKADLNLSLYRDPEAVLKDRKTWEKVLHNVRTGEMPPENKPQPSQHQRDVIAAWVESEIFKFDCKHPDPGRVTIRRLNRAEYNNTIRDLVGVDFRPADDFPADDSGYGFDNIGDVLSLPPVLMEKYLAAAAKILDKAILLDDGTNGTVTRLDAQKLESNAPGGPYGKRAQALNREGEIFTRFEFPADGEYIIRARAFGQQAGPEPAKMEFRVDGKPIQVFEVRAIERRPKVYAYHVHQKAGARRLAAAYINNYVNPSDPNPDNRDRNLYIDYLEVVGPLGPAVYPDTHKRIFFKQATAQNRAQVAREIIGRFARRAYRRPVTGEEVERLARFADMVAKDGGSFEESVKLSLQAVLVSPYFLFRGELQPEPNNPRSIHPVNEYALASRLSYFLWSSMPDEELFAQAEHGTLRKNLEAQVRRMLKDPKSGALVENFAGQWLQTRNLDLISPDPKLFPDFNDRLRAAMKTETELFFEEIMRHDRSLLEFINADYTFANETLARHYGIAGVKGDAFQKVSLKGTHRSGLLTQGSILTLTSNPTRTSPVKRGKWVLENILGTPPPPPPPDVPELKEGTEAVLSGTLRQRMEQHRADPICASCHARMDPIGFSFEHFDAIGSWRDKDGQFEIDPSGKLVSGETFKNPDELKGILIGQKRQDFIHCLSEKMLTYALGRGLEYYDKCAVDEISKAVTAERYKFSSLVLAVVKSAPFQLRRGEGERLTQASAE